MILPLESYADVALLFLRIVLCVIFLVHGLHKWSKWKMTAKQAQSSPAMHNTMRLLSIAEPLGALGLLTGTLTQLAALGLAIIMGGAMYNKIFKWKIGFSGKDGWELDLSILGGLVVLLVMGGGAIAIDALLKW